MTIGELTVGIALVAALLTLVLWLRDRGAAGDLEEWPVLTPAQRWTGGGRDFETDALAARLERAQREPELAARVAVDLHEALSTVIAARLRARVLAPGEDDPLGVELRAFVAAPPDPATLTTRAGLDVLLARIEAL